MGKAVEETEKGREYAALCEDVLAGRIPVKDFAERFLSLWYDDEREESDWEYHTYLGSLILPVDLYDPELYDFEDGLLNEEGLLKRVKEEYGIYLKAKAEAEK